jgi:4'-phosphopantetheinyl transferase EntD
LIEELLPPVVAAVEAFHDQADLALFPAEEAVVARSVDKRRREFATVRACARMALARLGIPPGPILPGARGAPAWPPGIVGSMTHCAGYRGAVVARVDDVHTIGVDAEPNQPLPDGVLDAVAGSPERAWLSELADRRPDVHWDRLLFSAKESVYKAWYPVAQRELDFDEALVRVAPDGGTFTARLLVPGPAGPDGLALTAFAGRWAAWNGLILTAIVMLR